MTVNRDNFYKSIVQKRLPAKNASILICGGGGLDKSIFLDLGYTNVTISNLDTRARSSDFAPYSYRHEDVQDLSFSENSYDYVVIHAAVHHASMPHKALLEMYRVAKIGVLAFESRDSFIMKLLIKLNLTQEYEQIAVFYNDCKFGGVNNTDIPNYVYRWTEREIEKTVQSFAPQYKHNFNYDYGSDYPYSASLEKNNSLKMIILVLMKPFYLMFSKIFYKQQNQFAFFISKPASDNNLFPWLERDEHNKNIKFNRSWGESRYKKK